MSHSRIVRRRRTRQSGGLPQLSGDQPLKRFDRLKIFRSDLVLRDCEIELPHNDANFGIGTLVAADVDPFTFAPPP
jgi:hypothetical protein